MSSSLPPVEGRLRTRCCKCQYPFYCGQSYAMKLGVNSGNCSCPSCSTFLHLEILEGDEAWTEVFDDFIQRTGKGIA